MKVLNNLIIMVILTFTAISCGEGTKKEDPVTTDPVVTTLESSSNTMLTRAEFDTMRDNWKRGFRSYMASDSLDYFEMPIADLKAVVNESGVDDSRFYLGMDQNGKPHLMLVGLSNSVIDFGVIADYSKACPPTCPPPKI